METDRVEHGGEVLELGHRLAPHVRTMEEAREATGIVAGAFDGP